MTRQRDHFIAVPAQHVAVDVLHADTGLQRHEGAHAGRVQDPGLADDALARQSRLLHGQVGHCVERVGQYDVDRVG